jgi:hypothetical protein
VIKISIAYVSLYLTNKDYLTENDNLKQKLYFEEIAKLEKAMSQGSARVFRQSR